MQAVKFRRFSNHGFLFFNSQLCTPLHTNCGCRNEREILDGGSEAGENKFKHVHALLLREKEGIHVEFPPLSSTQSNIEFHEKRFQNRGDKPPDTIATVRNLHHGAINYLGCAWTN